MLFKPRTLVLILALILSVTGAYGFGISGYSGGTSGTSAFSATMNSALDDTVTGRIVMNDGDLRPEFYGYGSFSERHSVASSDGSKYAEVRASVSGDARNYHYADNLGSENNVYAEQWLTADHASSIYGSAFAKNGANAAAVITDVTGGSVSGTSTSPGTTGFGNAYFMGAYANDGNIAKAVQSGTASGSKVVLDGYASDGTQNYNIKTILSDPYSSWCYNNNKATYTGTTIAQSGSTTSVAQTIAMTGDDGNAKLTVKDSRSVDNIDKNLQTVTLTHTGNFASDTLTSKSTGTIIGDMVKFAKSGDSLGIGKGTYKENVLVDKNLKISGSGACGSCDGSGCGDSCGGCGGYSGGCTGGYTGGCGGSYSGGCGGYSGGCTGGYTGGCGGSYSGGCGGYSGGCTGGDGSSTCGTVVDGQQLGSVFTIAAGKNVELSNMKITNGWAKDATGTGNEGNGGGIHNDGTLNVHDVMVTNNMANNNGGGLYNSGTATVKDSEISSNQAGIGSIANPNLHWLAGGGIYNSESGILNVNGGCIHDNSAKYGGGIMSMNVASIDSADIFNNKASRDGGGILADGSGPGRKLDIKDSVICNNEAVFNGGGIYGQSDVNIWNTVISSNKAVEGGGIFVSDADGSSMDIYSSKICKNSATWGGGIESCGVLNIWCSSISNNIAISDGGGIENGAHSKATLKNTKVFSNSAGRYGGGIDNWMGTLDVKDSCIYGNSAKYGGGISNAGTGGEADISSTTISSNTATQNGGGLYNENPAIMKLEGDLIQSNTAGNNGGGSYGTWIDAGSNIFRYNSPRP